MARVPHPSDYLHARFLKNSGLTKYGEVVAPRQRVGVAICGLGRAGSIHLSNIMRTPRFELLYLADTNKERTEQLVQLYCLTGTVTVITDGDLTAAFSDDRLHAVIISTPTPQHEELVCGALRAGKHVLCEKPIATSIQLIRGCYTLAKQSDRILLCAFNRRYDPTIVSLVEAVRGGAVGQVQCVSSVSRDSVRPPIDYLRTSGGIFHDCIVHDIDIICHIVGEFPTKVVAAVHAFSEDIAAINDHDTVVVTMKFPSGVLAHIDVSRQAVYGYDQRVEVHGSKGLLRSENQRPQALLSCTEDASSLVPIMHTFTSRYSEAYIRQTDHFLDLIDGSEEQVITVETVVNVTKVINALEESVRTEGFVTVSY
uniref:Inositol 2-dehydrogenase-like n=1 Tax=Hirondellea gigas TaxID=1518452 RepID=A0A2P2I8T8_9CRUS